MSEFSIGRARERRQLSDFEGTIWIPSRDKTVSLGFEESQDGLIVRFQQSGLPTVSFKYTRDEVSRLLAAMRVKGKRSWTS